MVEALLAAGASVEAKNIFGCGPPETGRMRQRCDTPLSLLPVLGASFQESSVYFTRFHVEKSTTSIQQLQVCVAGCCGYVTLDNIIIRSGSG